MHNIIYFSAVHKIFIIIHYNSQINTILRSLFIRQYGCRLCHVVANRCQGQSSALPFKDDLIGVPFRYPRFELDSVHNLLEVVFQIRLEGLNVVAMMFMSGVVVECRMGIIHRLVLPPVADSTHKDGVFNVSSKGSKIGSLCVSGGVLVSSGSLQILPAGMPLA